MKTAIIYYSAHHGNTRRLAEARSLGISKEELLNMIGERSI